MEHGVRACSVLLEADGVAVVRVLVHTSIFASLIAVGAMLVLRYWELLAFSNIKNRIKRIKSAKIFSSLKMLHISVIFNLGELPTYH